MLLHFIFVIKDKDLGLRTAEFEYVKKMAQFFKSWIKTKFSVDFDIQCDEMIAKPRIILQRLDTHSLLKDHAERGNDIYHFYLCYFRPLWTDCTCEGYRQSGYKRYIEDVHDTWQQHLFEAIPFEQYGEDFELTSKKPSFLTLDTTMFEKKS